MLTTYDRIVSAFDKRFVSCAARGLDEEIYADLFIDGSWDVGDRKELFPGVCCFELEMDKTQPQTVSAWKRYILSDPKIRKELHEAATFVANLIDTGVADLKIEKDSLEEFEWFRRENMEAEEQHAYRADTDSPRSFRGVVRAQRKAMSTTFREIIAKFDKIFVRCAERGLAGGCYAHLYNDGEWDAGRHDCPFPGDRIFCLDMDESKAQTEEAWIRHILGNPRIRRDLHEAVANVAFRIDNGDAARGLKFSVDDLDDVEWFMRGDETFAAGTRSEYGQDALYYF